MPGLFDLPEWLRNPTLLPPIAGEVGIDPLPPIEVMLAGCPVREALLVQFEWPPPLLRRWTAEVRHEPTSHEDITKPEHTA